MDSGLHSVQLPDLNIALDRLERRATGVEAWLSVLKRRRELAKTDARYWQNYRSTAQQAVITFPNSEPIAAIAAAAMIHNTAITREKEAELRQIIPVLTSSRFSPIRLSLHVLLGDFRNPETAAANLPDDIDLFPDLLSFRQSFTPQEAEAIVTNLIIMKNLAGDVRGASENIQGALAVFPSRSLIRFAAEYYYDFGDLRYSAELFSLLPDEADLTRRVDALWLAGYAGRTRNLWRTKSETGSPAAQSRALYNLAVTAENDNEKAALLERLSKLNTGDPSHYYGFIRYSRLFNAHRAIDLLETERQFFDPSISSNVLVDLEILKRKTEIGEVGRIIAETWELLDLHPQEENLYQWGAWYFNLQNRNTENEFLLRNAARNNFSGQWFNIHESLRLIREGRLDLAEEILTAIPAGERTWATSANLGRIFESRHAPSRAVENYERAMAALPAGEFINASRIQVRIAHCLRTMGRNTESRQALEKAVELNPDNLNARFELSRM
jgi:tetratricopeptide (TPR) repeat protein